MITRRNRILKREQEKMECERCGRKRNKADLVEDDGWLVCPETCKDEPSYRETDDE